MKILLLVALSTLCSLSSAAPRKWTVTDGSTKPFDGEFVAVQSGVVTIKKKSGGRFFTPLASLSQEDRDFIAGEEKAKAEAAAVAEAASKLKTSAMAKAVSGKAFKLDGKKLKKWDVLAAKAPEYYLLYWAGSWCPACQDSMPRLVKDYDEVISKARNIEAILLSCDSGQDNMTGFMRDLKLPFPAIALDQWQKEKLFKSMEPSQLPGCKLVDAAGNVLAEGDAAKAKARTLAAGTAAK